MAVPTHHTDVGLDVVVAEPEFPAALPPVLLVHGFASSVRLTWEQTGWFTALLAAGRRVIAADLPGHGASPAPEDVAAYAPSRIRHALLRIATDAGARPITAGDPTSGLDVIGYSFGSRLAWELGAGHPDIVRRLVLGGASNGDPLARLDLAAAQRFLADGTPVGDVSTGALVAMMQAAPDSDAHVLLRLVEAVKQEPYDAATAVPPQPVLVVWGQQDELVGALPVLEQLVPTAEVHTLPGRTHVNAVSARAFKQAAIEFLARD
ncbi:alpha/beta fold hydrolase [Intrasporangium sp.]|uniref:alpha/beta fold hydrolase n=1 Tax=Intrasporangium sp. TaxID=1925024 RepID=UPI003221BEC2